MKSNKQLNGFLWAKSEQKHMSFRHKHKSLDGLTASIEGSDLMTNRYAHLFLGLLASGGLSAFVSPHACASKPLAIPSSRIVLQRGHGTIIAPGQGKQSYTKFPIDVSKYESGTLYIDIQLGTGPSAGSFDLFPEGAIIPTEGRPKPYTLVGSYDIPSGSRTTLRYECHKPQRFIFAADGNWGSPKWSANTIDFVVSIENGKLRPQKTPTHKRTPRTSSTRKGMKLRK